MRFRDQDMPLDPDVERELAAVDAGLMGLRVAPDLEDLAELAQDTRAARPAPESDFAAKLDEWAAAGFPRDGRLGDGGEGERGSARGGLREWLRSTPPRRLLLPVCGAATLLVAAAVGISVSDQIGGSSQSGPTVQGFPGTVAESSGGKSGTAANTTAGRATHSVGSPPTLGQLQPTVKRDASRATPFVHRLSVQAAGAVGSRGDPRKVAQNADLVLSTEPQNVRDVADGVVGVVDQYHGFVVSSNVTSGQIPIPVPLEQADTRGARSQQGTGTFELRIPAQKLQDALGAMSDLPHAHVASRTEGTVDITKRFNSAKAQVEDLEAQRTSLLNQLADAVTIEEADSIKAQLRIVENKLADAKDTLGHVQTRIHLVPVNVEIRGQQGVDSGAGGGWSIGDAFHDAGRVLTVIAGILLISAAVLAPIGLIGGLAWFTARALIRRRREDALE